MKNQIYIALVLHKINRFKKNNHTNFEDISLEFFENLLDLSIKFEQKLKRKYKYIFTFDDGNLSDYQLAMPLIIKKKIRSIFFICPDLIGKSDYLTWSMVKEMHNYGIIIGSHSFSHKRLTLLKDDEVRFELIRSKRIIEDSIGDIVENFACPFGLYNAFTQKEAKNVGYRNFFVSNHGIYKQDNFVKPRNSINSRTSIQDAVSILNPSIIQRILWKKEDVTKKTIKKLLGEDGYINLRNRIL